MFNINTMFNNEGSKLTIEQLRSFKGLHEVTDEEANNIIETLYQLSVIGFEKITMNLNSKNE